MLLKDLIAFGERKKAGGDGLEKLLILVKGKVALLKVAIDSETAKLIEEAGVGGGGVVEARKDFFCGRGLAGHWKKGELIDGSPIVKGMAVKLNGKNPEKIINELLQTATSDDKLAEMFEGWCSFF